MFKLFKNAVILLLLIFLCNNLIAQSTHQKDEFGVLIKRSNGSVRLDVCNSDIIRIRIADGDLIPERNSLVVNKKWEKVPFLISEKSKNIELSTSDLIVRISKTGDEISFYNKNKRLILKQMTRDIHDHQVSGNETKSLAVTFGFSVNEAVYGLGQHQAGIMNYRGKTQWLDQANMEVALPFLLSNNGYGVLWDNYSRTLFDGTLADANQYKLESESGKCIDYYFMFGNNTDEVIAAYREATGVAPMFPKWSFGLFQSMDKYENSDDLLRVSRTYREKQIPFDCIVQDWRYWDPYPWGSHMMNENNYSDPKATIDSLHQMNVHTMISIWPIHTEGDTYYTEFENIDANYPSNGTHHYYDPHNAKARKIYWRQLNERLFGKYGWDAWWADGCEPENWPDTYDRKAFTTGLGAGTEYYNTYPLMHNSAVYEGWRKDISGKRLFTLSRSAFSGQQRYATTVWSGDIKSNWEDYKKQLSGGLNFCMSGMPYWTTDIGGYWGTDWTLPSNRELFTRWFQFGTFCPIFRIHGKLERTLYSEQSWDEETRKNLLVFDQLRYRLMPYIYSLAGKVTLEDYTIMRHLIMDYPDDKNVQNIDDQFMFGPAFLVSPIVDEGVTERMVYLPKGEWFDFWTGEKITGGKTILVNSPLSKLPLYIKSGSIIPMGPDIQYANESIDPLEIRIYEGTNGEFNLYEDEGDSYNYENGSYSIIPFSYNNKTKTLTLGQRSGSYQGMPLERNFKIVCVKKGVGIGMTCTANVETEIHYSGQTVIVNLN